jgi:hypothetical protein
MRLNEMKALGAGRAPPTPDTPWGYGADGIPFSHVQVRDPFDGKLYWEANPNVYELPESLGGVKAAEGRTRGGSEGTVRPKRKYPKYGPQPKTGPGTYDFRNFPVR